MAFQSSVSAQMGFGVVGELAVEGPLVAQPARIVSGDAANNVVGRAFTVTSGGTGSWDGTSADAGDPAPLIAAAGGTNPFAGILANPKVYPGLGTQAGGTLAPTLTLPNNQMAELILEHPGVIVTLAAAAVGDVVYFANATGILATTAPGAAAPANHQGPIGRVERYSNAGAGLAVISVFTPRVIEAA